MAAIGAAGVGVSVSALLATVLTLPAAFAPCDAAWGRQPADERTGHVADGPPVGSRSRTPASGQRDGMPAGYRFLKEAAFGPGEPLRSLEHGARVVRYYPERCPRVRVPALRRVGTSAPSDGTFGLERMIATPAHGRGRAIAIVACRSVDEIGEADGARIVDFCREHVRRGPELVS